MHHPEVRQKYSAARRIFSFFSRCFTWWWNTESYAWYITSNTRSLYSRFNSRNVSSEQQSLLTATSSLGSPGQLFCFLVCLGNFLHLHTVQPLIQTTHRTRISCTITLLHFNSGTQPRSQGSPLYPSLRSRERETGRREPGNNVEWNSVFSVKLISRFVQILSS